MTTTTEEHGMEDWEESPGDEWMNYPLDLDAVARHCHAPTMREWLTPEDPAILALVEVALGLWDGDPSNARDWLLLRCDQLRRPVTKH